MVPAKVIVAVDVVGSTAAAVVYLASDPEPSFKYRDSRHRKRESCFFRRPYQIALTDLEALSNHAKTRALGWSVGATNAGLAAARAIERAIHLHPQTLDGMAREEVQIWTRGAERLDANHVYDCTQFLGCKDWRVGAATVIARYHQELL